VQLNTIGFDLFPNYFIVAGEMATIMQACIYRWIRNADSSPLCLSVQSIVARASRVPATATKK
jgi:hypothetical protein